MTTTKQQELPQLAAVTDRRITDMKPVASVSAMIDDMDVVEEFVDKVAEFPAKKIEMMAKVYEAMDHPMAGYLKALVSHEAEPEKSTKQKHSRKSRKLRGRYAVPGHSSQHELAEALNLPLKTVRATLVKEGLTKIVTHLSTRRVVLTEEGRKYGSMWSDSKQMFIKDGHNAEMATNAQPVFTDDVLRFF